jgi:hypothetical protein
VETVLCGGITLRCPDAILWISLPSQFAYLLSKHQDEIITLRRKLQHSEAEIISLKERLSCSMANVTAASSDVSGPNSVGALKLVIDVLHRDMTSLQNCVSSANQTASIAHMESVFQLSRFRAASAVAAAIPSSQRLLLQACATFQCELDVQA